MYTLLIVDDEDAVRNRLKQQIAWESYDFQVIGDCARGILAEDEIRAKQPDLLLTDIKMPDISGLELIKRAKKIKPDIQTIILSAYDAFPFAQQAMLYEVVGYLLKPIEPDELDVLMRKVRENLARQKREAPCASSSHHLSEQIRSYVRMHYAEKITLEHLSSVFYTNPSYISATFKSKTGISLSDYVVEVRIHEAKRLLATSSHRVQEIAAEVGYEDYTYFCTVFRKKVGMTPLEYRFAHQ